MESIARSASARKGGVMATVSTLRSAAQLYVDPNDDYVEVVGTYETDELKWLNVYFGSREEKIAFEIEIFGGALVPDEILESGYIEVHKRHFLH